MQVGQQPHQRAPFQAAGLLHAWLLSHQISRYVCHEGPQCQATHVAQWIWWWQCLAAWHCRSVWSLSCHFIADVGDFALSMAKSHWHGALHSTHKSCTHSHMPWKRGGGKRELVAVKLCYDQSLLPSITCLGRLCITWYIFNLWQPRQRFVSLA